MKRLIACLTGICAPVLALAGPADWLLEQAGSESTLSPQLLWQPDGDRVQTADPIVFPNGSATDWTAIPQTQATFQMVVGRAPYYEGTAAFLAFTDSTPTCRKSVGVLGVDAGMGAFLTPKAQASIQQYLTTLPDGWSLYDGLIYDQNGGDRDNLTVFKLPDGTEFPGFSTGGDGGFLVSALYDAQGNMSALLVDLSRATPSPFTLPDC